MKALAVVAALLLWVGEADAWVLWQHWRTQKDGDTYTPSEAYESKAECDKDARGIIDGFVTLSEHAPNLARRGTFIRMAPTWGTDSFTGDDLWTNCLPDTIDPRGAKR